MVQIHGETQLGSQSLFPLHGGSREEGVAGARWAVASSQATTRLPGWSPQPPRRCTFGRGANRRSSSFPVCIPQPNSLGGTSRGVPLGGSALLVARCPWQPFRGTGFLWAGKAPRFLSANIQLNSLVVTCRSCAGRHSKQSPGPDYGLAVTSWGRRCWQRDEGGPTAAPRAAAEGDCPLTPPAGAARGDCGGSSAGSMGFTGS